MKKTPNHEDLKLLSNLFFKNHEKVKVIDDKKQFPDFGETINRHKLSRGHEFPQLMVMPGSKASFTHYDRVLEFGNSRRDDHVYRYSMRYITVNGAIRWVYPTGRLKAVIQFYHASTRRAKLFKLGLRVLGALHLDRLLSKPLTIHTDEKNCFHSASLEDMSFDDFSIFMGTPGIERTILIGLFEGKKCLKFLKLGLNKCSRKNVENEGRFLYRLQQKEWTSVELPALVSRSSGAIVVSKLQTSRKETTHRFTPLHAKALIEIADASRSLQRFDFSTYGECILDYCAFIRRNGNPLSTMEKKLLEVVENTPKDLYFPSSLAHGDFTPWNMFAGNEKLYIYDWETAMHYAPLLYDFFHYHFQTGIFLKGWDFDRIYSEIKFSIESHEVIRKSVDRYSVDVKTHLQLYLMHAIAKKSALKRLQPEKNNLQLSQRDKVWEDALNFVAPSHASHRSAFIMEFHAFLGEYNYAFLKFDAERLENIPSGSDLDVAIDKRALNDLLTFCLDSNYVARMRKVKKSFMTTIELFFQDGDYLSIDLIYDFKRRAVRFMKLEELLASARENAFGIKVPSLQHDLEYALMFYALNGARLPAKYVEFFGSKAEKEQRKALNFFQQKYQLSCPDFNSLLHSGVDIRAEFLKHIKKEQQSSPVTQLILAGRYISDTLKDRTTRKGFIITFSGVDGVGKTTIIENVREKLQKKYRKEVVLLHHRPKILPMLSALKYGSGQKAEANAESANPNIVTPKTKVSSYIRFGYYYLDYVLGQFYVQVRYVLAGKIVMYDRYYFDMINHPERNNLVVHRGFAKWLYRPILKPALNVYLNASSEQIFYRKRELSIPEIEQLSHKYVSLFHELSGKSSTTKYVLHRNEDLDETVREILYDVQQIA